MFTFFKKSNNIILNKKFKPSSFLCYSTFWGFTRICKLFIKELLQIEYNLKQFRLKISKTNPNNPEWIKISMVPNPLCIYQHFYIVSIFYPDNTINNTSHCLLNHQIAFLNKHFPNSNEKIELWINISEIIK